MEMLSFEEQRVVGGKHADQNSWPSIVSEFYFKSQVNFKIKRLKQFAFLKR